MAHPLITEAVTQAINLAKSGVNLALHSDSSKDQERLLQFTNGLRKTYVNVVVSIHCGNLGTSDAVDKLFSDVVAQHGRVDMVVSSTGTIVRRPAQEKSESKCNSILAYSVFVDEQRRRTVERLHVELKR
jgi:short-subunit dehydrogenase